MLNHILKYLESKDVKVKAAFTTLTGRVYILTKTQMDDEYYLHVMMTYFRIEAVFSGNKQYHAERRAYYWVRYLLNEEYDTTTRTPQVR